jgi:hypothetical protein
MRRWGRVAQESQTGIWLGNQPTTMRSTDWATGDGAKQRFRHATWETCARARPKSRFVLSGLLRSHWVGPTVCNQWCFCPLKPCHSSGYMVEFPIRYPSLEQLHGNAQVLTSLLTAFDSFVAQQLRLHNSYK